MKQKSISKKGEKIIVKPFKFWENQNLHKIWLRTDQNHSIKIQLMTMIKKKNLIRLTWNSDKCKWLESRSYAKKKASPLR